MSQLRPGLYVIATPIGNLGDITIRALEILKGLNILYSEDTRITSKLLTHYGIKLKLQIYNDHSALVDREIIYNAIREGKAIGLVSDAGSPLIADPGYKLVKYLLERKVYVTVIPGASSIIAGLTLGQLPTDQFSFLGFMPNSSVAKAKLLEKYSDLPHTLVIFETSNRLLSTLEAIHKILGDREVGVVREITKMFEEVIKDKVSTLIEHYNEVSPKGEIVLLIAGKTNSISDFTKELKILLKYTNVKTASSILSELKNISKNIIYKEALALKDE